MTSIKLKKSSVAGKIPTDSDLAHGELAINFQDGKLFYKDASNNVKAFIDSAAVGSLITAGQGLDSDGVKSVIFDDTVINGDLILNRDSSTDPTIHLTGQGPNTIRFHDGHDASNTNNAVDIAYRTSPNDLRIERAENGHIMAEFGGNDGHVKIYHASSSRLETNSSGVLFNSPLATNGDVTFDSTGAISFDKSDQSLKFGDNYRARFGASDDLQIYHDGNNSIVRDAGQGDLFIRGSTVRLDDTTSKDYLVGNEGSSVELYFNGTKKFETTATGAKIHGNTGDAVLLLEADSTNTDENDNARIEYSQDGGGVTASHGTDGNNRFFIQTTTGGGTTKFDMHGGAETRLYYASNIKLETLDSGVNITGNLRINNAPADFGLDSTSVINIIDSDYVLNRSGISIPVLSEDSSLAFNQRLSFQAQTSTDGVLEVQPKMSVLDSAGTETLVNVNFTGGGGIDSAATVAIINDRFTTDVTFGGDVTFDSANAVFFDKSDQSLSFGNNRKAKFGPVGGGGGLSVTHTGSFGFVDTNFMQIRNNGGTKVAAQFFPTSAQRLFHNGFVKFETTDSGVRTFGSILGDSATINGPATISGDLTLDSAGAVFFDKSDKSLKIGENHIAKFGENGDFEVKHTNGNSILKANNGPIFIQTNATNFGVHIGKTNASETMGKFIPDGAVELYHNNIKKFETTDSGVTVTGRLRADSATISGMRFPTADGDANQAIITDGAGNLTFGTVSGGGGGTGGVAGTTNAATAQSFVGDSSTTTFTMTGAVPSDSDDVLVFINGILQHTDNYSLSGNALTLDSAPHTGDKIETRKLAVRSTNVSLRDYRNYIYTTTGSSTTTFSGADSGGTSLAYDVGKLEVYLNGSRLVNGKDYTATNGTSVVLDSAVSAGNIVEVVSLAAAVIENPGILAVDSDLTSTDSGQVIHSFDRAAFRTVKYIVQLEHDSDNKYHSEEILLSHNNTIVGMTTYAQLLLDSNLGTFDADISGTDVRLKVTPTKTNTSVKLRAIRVGA